MKDLKALIKQMTLEEKAGMCSGLDFWHTKNVERLGIPSIMVSDGPCGLRKQDSKGDHLGMNDSIKAVCFPSGCLTTCSFDTELLQKEGEIIGDECQAEDISVILGPAVNIKRSPLCGRNFEYLSEDPYLAGEMSAAFVKGVQSKNIGTSIKHFAVNNQEFRRMSASSNVDERTLREIYLPAFEKTIKEGKPDTVMGSYNRLNGVFASENQWLLTDVLRKEWGFDGFVVSDWGAVNKRIDALKAGLDLEMPASGGVTDKQIVEAVKNGTLDEKVLDTAVERILRIVYKFTDGRQKGNFDKDAHHLVVAQIARESMVLLKNKDNVLPLSQNETDDILFVGLFAKKPRYEGGGSSHINTWKVTSALDALKEANLNVKYVQGYDVAEKDDEKLLKEAIENAKNAKTVVIFAGLPDSYESEGYDRTHLNLPKNQNILIEEIAKLGKKIVIVLHNGAPVEMPWIEKVDAVLESYLGGEAVGNAQVDLIFGKANPCGKLAESFPIKLSDNPSFLNFPGNGNEVDYKEGIFVGYRYYDKKDMAVLFPFGHGLSYTNFEYSDISLSSSSILDSEKLEVSVKVTNKGKMAGKEIVQLYVSQKTGTREIRPEKELKGFKKVHLEVGETKTVTFTLDKRSFAFYDTKRKDWFAPTGDYEILVGASSRDIRLSTTVKVTTTSKEIFRVYENSVFQEILEHPAAAKILKPVLDDCKKNMSAGSESSKESISDEMIDAMMSNMPLRALRSFSGILDDEVSALIKKMNDELAK